MSDDVTRLAEVLRGADELAYDNMHADWAVQSIAKHILASEWLAERDALNRLLGATQAKSDAIDAHAELVARMEALVPAECWVSRTVEFRCTDYVGGEFANGHVFSEDMCCLPCRIRAALNDPTEETP